MLRARALSFSPLFAVVFRVEREYTRVDRVQCRKVDDTNVRVSYGIAADFRFDSLVSRALSRPFCDCFCCSGRSLSLFASSVSLWPVCGVLVMLRRSCSSDRHLTETKRSLQVCSVSFRLGITCFPSIDYVRCGISLSDLSRSPHSAPCSCCVLFICIRGCILYFILFIYLCALFCTKMIKVFSPSLSAARFALTLVLS